MTTWCRMRANASVFFSAAAVGAALLVSPAGAQEQWRTPTDYRSAQLRSDSANYRQYRGYDDDRLITPSARPITDQPQADWTSHIDRVARLESQLESLKTTRVAELEAEIVKLNDRVAASGDMLQGIGGGYGSCGNGNCGNGNCGNSCGEPCCPPVQNGWYAGFEFLFLKPSFENSTAFITSQNGGVANRSNAGSKEFDYNYDLATRLILGYTGNSGLGFRTRYFYYNQGSNRPSFAVPAAGDAETPAIEPILGNGQQFFLDNGGAPGFRAQSSLELQTWDWEVTNQLTFCRSLVTIGGGLRYAMMEQRYRVDAIHASGHIQESLYNMRDFYGVGPTFAVDLLRPIRCCSGLSLYFNARGSALIGDSNQVYKKVDGTSGLITESYTRNDADNSLYIAEIGLGLQYSRGMFFGRGGWEGQYWSGIGGPTTNQGNLGLQGLSLMLGLNY